MPKRPGALRRPPAGFTLIELMIVVAITGILASLAVPAFNGYKMRARAWQAEEILHSIGLKEEAYRGEFGSYLSAGSCSDATDGVMDYPPATGCFQPGVPTGKPVAFVPAGTNFDALGVNPGGSVYFGFAVSAGVPGTTVPGAPLNMAQDFWWVAQASADLDNDGTAVIFEYTSQSRRVWCSSQRGWD